MIDGTYELLVEGRRGTAVLETSGDVLKATVKIPGFPRQRGIGACAGDAFFASGSVKVPLAGVFEYELEGTVRGDLLEATCRTIRGSFEITGIRI